MKRAVRLASLGALVLGVAVEPVAAAGTSSHKLMAWGDNGDCQLGVGCHPLQSAIPLKARLPKGTRVTALAAGGTYTLAVTSTGGVLAWGADFDGQLGDGKTTSLAKRPVKVKLPKGTKVTMVAAGNAHSLALTSTGSVLAWGYNKYGQLGNGKTANSNMPVKVKLPKGTKVTGVCTGYSDSLALTSSGSVLAWGYNKQGELGDGTSKRSTVPVKVKLPKSTKATAIACGIEHGLVLTSKDSVLAWGYDKYGQLGNGKTANSKVPVKVKLPKGTKVTAIAGGANFSLVRTSHGSLLSWGYNGDGELGDGNNANSALPVPVELPTGVTAKKIAPGGNMALTSTGSLLAWGYNFFGQVGDGTTFNRQLPVPVDLPTGTKVITIASGPAADHSLALVR